MLVGAALILALVQTKTVVTSADILKSERLSAAERNVAAKHRWILSGPWSEESDKTFKEACSNLTTWRAKDIATESEAGASESQKCRLANWKTQIEATKEFGLSELKKLVLEQPPQSFSLSGLNGGKWIYIDKDTGQSDIARKLYASSSKRIGQTDISSIFCFARAIPDFSCTFRLMMRKVGNSTIKSYHWTTPGQMTNGREFPSNASKPNWYDL